MVTLKRRNPSNANETQADCARAKGNRLSFMSRRCCGDKGRGIPKNVGRVSHHRVCECVRTRRLMNRQPQALPLYAALHLARFSGSGLHRHGSISDTMKH